MKKNFALALIRPLFYVLQTARAMSREVRNLGTPRNELSCAY
jgi:hypothetical protein